MQEDKTLVEILESLQSRKDFTSKIFDYFEDKKPGHKFILNNTVFIQVHSKYLDHIDSMYCNTETGELIHYSRILEHLV